MLQFVCGKQQALTNMPLLRDQEPPRSCCAGPRRTARSSVLLWLRPEAMQAPTRSGMPPLSVDAATGSKGFGRRPWQKALAEGLGRQKALAEGLGRRPWQKALAEGLGRQNVSAEGLGRRPCEGLVQRFWQAALAEGLGRQKASCSGFGRRP